MSAADSPSPLVSEVLDGGSRELRMLAARGMLPLPFGELVELQVALAGGRDDEVAETAVASLQEVDPQRAAELIAEGVSDQALEALALHLPHPTVLEAVLGQRSAPHELLTRLASRLGPEMQEILLLRQDAIVEEPAILDALEVNPRLTSYARRRIREYREHLLPRRAVPQTAAAVAEKLEREAAALSDTEVEGAIESAREAPAAGSLDELTGLTESQVRTLPVPVRLALARGAPRTLRSILVRDSHPIVATSVLRFAALGESEIEEIAGNRQVCAEVLELIGRDRGWVRRYPIAIALARNPRCPPAVALRLVPRFAVRDLLSISRDRSVAHEIRSAADRLYKIKTR